MSIRLLSKFVLLFCFIPALAQQQFNETQTKNLVADLASKSTIVGVQQQTYTYAVDTGTANAYAVAPSPTPALVAGTKLAFLAAHANTGASTLTVGGTTKAITKSGTTALSGSEIVANQIIYATYDGTQWQLLSGSGSSSGITQLTGDVLAGAGSGSQVATLANTGVAAGTYSNPTITFDSKGRATYAVNGGTPTASNFAHAVGGQGTTSFSLSYTPAVAATILVAVSGRKDDIANLTSLTSATGNVFALVGYGADGGGGSFTPSVKIYACWSPASSSADTIGASFSAALNSSVGISAVQYSNLVSMDTGVVWGYGPSSPNSNIVSPSLTTTNANDLVIVFGEASGAATPVTVNSPFTSNGSTTVNDAYIFGSYLVSATGTYTSTVNFGGVGGSWPQIMLLAIKTASGGSGAVVNSFNTRTGAVVPTTGDYTDAQISFSDITTNNTSTSKHGYTPKLPGDATKYLDGTGVFSVPPSATGTNATQIQGVNVSTTAPTTSQVLQYNGSQYVPATVSGSGGSSTISIGTRTSLPSSVGATGTTYITTDSPYNYTSNGTNWQARAYGQAVTEPLPSQFTHINFGTNTPTISNTYGGIQFTGSFATQDNFLILGVAVSPSSTLKVAFGLMGQPNWANINAGFVAYNSNTGKYLIFRMVANALYMSEYTTSTGLTTNISNISFDNPWPNRGVVCMRFDGASVYLESYADTQCTIKIASLLSQTLSTWIGTNYTYVGVGTTSGFDAWLQHFAIVTP